MTKLDRTIRLREAMIRMVRIALGHGAKATNSMLAPIIDRYMIAPEELTPLRCPLCSDCGQSH